MPNGETEVLVVGAGPVGMMTALLLAESGVRVRLIDQGGRPTTRSYACVLHSNTLRLLSGLGVLESAREQGRRVETVGIYDGKFRRAEVKLTDLPSPGGYALTLPQSSLEALLETRLEREFGIHVEWNQRLASLALSNEGIAASVEHLTQTAQGFIGHEWGRTIHKRMDIRADFVVGADGHDSTVRRHLGIQYEVIGEPEVFVVVEFGTEPDPALEARIVIDGQTSNVLWPLPGDRARWSFQLTARDAEEFLPKDRKPETHVAGYIDEIKRHYAEGLARARAPWFHAPIKDVQWSVRICFQRGLVDRFGLSRGWLVGDAAHQAGPIGVQSLNAGLCEAEDLAAKLTSVLRHESSPRVLESYDEVHRGEWKRLFGITNSQISKASTDDWTRTNCARIVACLPATGHDLNLLAGQLGLTF